MSLRSLLIEATSHCNARCPHCPRHDSEGHLNPYLTLAHLTPDILPNLDKTILQSLQSVVFEGDKGDPGMNPHIVDLVRFFDFVPQIWLYTNGGMRSQAWWEALATVPNLHVVWSIDGLGDTNHLYRVNVNYQKVIDNARAFLSNGGKAYWKCLLFKHNQHQIDQIKDLARHMKFRDVQFRSADQSRFSDRVVWEVKSHGKFLHNIEPCTLTKNQIIAASVKIENYHHGYGSKSNFDRKCPWAQQNLIYINYLGQVIPCCMMHFETQNDYLGRDRLLEMAGGSFDTINLYHNNLAEILAGPMFGNLELSLHDQTSMHPVCKKSCFPQKNLI